MQQLILKLILLKKKVIVYDKKELHKNGLIRSFKVDNERIYATLEINGI